MDWQELEAFRTLSEELHFGRTADRLFVSRARISQLIKSLERRVGAPLFERTSRRVMLTPIGRQLCEDLGPHVDGIHRALAKASDAARGIGDTLRVGFSSPRASELVVRIMADFRVRHPECDVQIREVHLSDRYGAVRRGELDVLLIEFPVDEPDLVTGPVLFSDERVVAVSSSHPFAHRESVELDDLGDETVLIIAGMPGYFTDQLISSHTPNGRPVHRVLVTTYWQELLTLVAAGRGITICAAQGARYYPRPDLVYIPLADASPLEYGLVWSAVEVDPMGREFARLAIEKYAERSSNHGRSVVGRRTTPTMPEVSAE